MPGRFLCSPQNTGTELQGLGLALLGLALFCSFLALPPFLSLAMEILILFHRVLEGCNLLFDFTRTRSEETALGLLRDFELQCSLHVAAARLAPTSEEALRSHHRLYHPEFPDHTSHENNGCRLEWLFWGV